ncbi:MAG: hemolysin III family protein [Eubacterium sp.]|nr:hemolysin III family protein [Eubacterium sp.]
MNRHLIQYIKDPGSAITHFIALVGAVVFSFPLIGKAVGTSNATAVAAMVIFISSMILLYGASTSYHTFDISKAVNLALRRVDHAMIFVLIAGSYTPVCLLVLDRAKGIPLLVFIWAAAIAGIILKIFIIGCPKWVSSIIYISMGWACIFVFRSLLTDLPPAAFGWLLAGGIVYTIGGILYGLKLPVFNRLPKCFGSHEIFHLFVMGGSICHYIFMYAFLI